MPPYTPLDTDSNTSPPHESHGPSPMVMYEWEILSYLHPGDNIQVDELDMLSHRDFDTNHNWAHTNIPLHLQESTISFIDVNHSSNQVLVHPCSTFMSPN